MPSNSHRSQVTSTSSYNLRPSRRFKTISDPFPVSTKATSHQLQPERQIETSLTLWDPNNIRAHSTQQSSDTELWEKEIEKAYSSSTSSTLGSDSLEGTNRQVLANIVGYIQSNWPRIPSKFGGKSTDPFNTGDLCVVVSDLHMRWSACADILARHSRTCIL